MRKNPNVAKAIYGVNSTGRIIRREELAEVLDVQRVLVGQSFINTARKGQNASLTRTWGKDCALLHTDPAASSNHGVTWDYTAVYEDMRVKRGRDERAGLNGAEIVKVTQSCKEIVAAKRTGFLFKTVVA